MRKNKASTEPKAPASYMIENFKEGFRVAHTQVAASKIVPILKQAKKLGLTLESSDIKCIDDQLTIDGMDPDGWFRVMSAD